jgi:hypothetical protein
MIRYAIFSNVDLIFHILSFLVDENVFEFPSGSVTTNHQPILPLILSFKSLYQRFTDPKSKLKLRGLIVSHPYSYVTSVTMIRWAIDMRCNFGSDIICKTACANGSLSILIWARSQSPPFGWSTDCSQIAASHGHLHVLQWLQLQRPPCPMSIYDVCKEATQKGHLDVVARVVVERKL